MVTNLDDFLTAFGSRNALYQHRGKNLFFKEVPVGVGETPQRIARIDLHHFMAFLQQRCPKSKSLIFADWKISLIKHGYRGKPEEHEQNPI